MKTNIQKLREEQHLTQTELAEKSGLSLRTIQRIEAGNTPKGFTLKALANVFNLEPQMLLKPSLDISHTNRAKLINLSTLIGLIIPFGGVIFPLILTKKTSDQKNKDLGKNIISIQILLAVLLSSSLIICPFIQKHLAISFPLFLLPLLTFISIKVLLAMVNGISLNKKNDLPKYLRFNYL